MLNMYSTQNKSKDETFDDSVSERKVQMAWQLFVSLEYQVQVADRKVQAVFGLNAFLVAALSLQNQQPLDELMKNGFNTALVIDLFFKGLLLLSVCLATWSALSALTPRVKSTFKTGQSNKESLFFFVHIHAKSAREFSDDFINLSNSAAVDQILAQTQAISGILTLKYKLLHRSTVFLSIALMIWILISVNRFLS